MEVFRPFYLVDQSHDPKVITTPASRLEANWRVNGIEHARYEGRVWRATGIKVGWSPGPIAFSRDETPYRADHWHTGFMVQKHAVHIDFISFFCMGPQTAYREYRVFCDGEEVKRGGGFMGFLMGVFTRQRNWPLAIEIEDHLIRIDKLLQYWVGSKQGQITPEEACSLWVIADAS
jgi:hypothetical protein